jgi:hypothetical protein
VNWFVAHLSLAVLAQPILWNPSVSSFQSYDDTFEFSLDDGCHYDAHIAGTLTPVFSYLENGREVEPNFDISAHLVCPHMAPLHVAERIEHTGPLTRERVETLISHHAAITWEYAERRCIHVPTIRFQGENLTCTGVNTSCTRSESY